MNKGELTEDEAAWPDLGPIPPPSPTASHASPELDDESALEDDEMDEDDEEEKPRSRRKRPRRDTVEDNEDGDTARRDREDPRRKRGRPPRVDTPMECRIKNIMKGLRKLKDPRYDAACELYGATLNLVQW